jgi:hypothetical protein
MTVFKNDMPWCAGDDNPSEHKRLEPKIDLSFMTRQDSRFCHAKQSSQKNARRAQGSDTPVMRATRPFNIAAMASSSAQTSTNCLFPDPSYIAYD